MKQLILSLTFVATFLLIAWLFQRWAFKHIFPWLETKISKLAKQFTWKYSIILFEIIFIFLSIILFYSTLYNAFVSLIKNINWFLCAYAIIILIDSNLIYQTRITHKEWNSLFNLITKKIDFHNYFIKRTISIFEHLGFSLSLILLLAFSYKLVVINKILHTETIIFITFLFLPLFTAIWVYFPSIKKDESAMNTRRIIIYILITIWIIYQAYGIFQNSLHPKSFSVTSFEYIFLNIAAIVFAALDRIFKTIIDDYKQFGRK